MNCSNNLFEEIGRQSMGMTSDQKDNMMHSENQLCASQMNLLHSHAFKKGV